MTDSHKGHRARLREKFMTEGTAGLSPAQILELMLFNTVPRRDTFPIAERLLERFGDLNGVFSADIAELKEIPGVSDNTAVMLKSLKDVYIQYAEPDYIGKISANHYDAISGRIKSLAQTLDESALVAIFLDERGFAARYEIFPAALSSADMICASAKTYALRAVVIALYGDFSAEGTNYPRKLAEALREALSRLGVETRGTYVLSKGDM